VDSDTAETKDDWDQLVEALKTEDRAGVGMYNVKDREMRLYLIPPSESALKHLQISSRLETIHHLMLGVVLRGKKSSKNCYGDTSGPRSK